MHQVAHAALGLKGTQVTWTSPEVSEEQPGPLADKEDDSIGRRGSLDAQPEVTAAAGEDPAGESQAEGVPIPTRIVHKMSRAYYNLWRDTAGCDALIEYAAALAADVAKPQLSEPSKYLFIYSLHICYTLC